MKHASHAALAAALCVFLFPTVAHAGAPLPCAPSQIEVAHAGLEAPVVASGADAQGSSSTVVSDDAYAVNTCGADGTWARTDVMTAYGTDASNATWVRTAEYRELADGTVQSVYFDLAEPTEASADSFDPAGGIAPVATDDGVEIPSAAEALESTEPQATSYDGTGLAEQQANALDQCSATTYNTTGGGYSGANFAYRIRHATVPFGNAITAIQAGHNRWNDTSNSCGFNDTSESTNFSYAGDSGANGVHSYSDGSSISDFGSLSNVGVTDSAVIAATWTWRLGSTIVETDQRYSSSRSWTTSGAGGAFDIEAVATHETGHSLGLADQYSQSNSNLTMYGRTNPGSTKQRTLGRGDILGMRALY